VWDRLEQAVHEAAPDVEARRTFGVDESYDPDGWTTTNVELPGTLQEEETWGLSTYGPSIAVAHAAAEVGVLDELAGRVDAALADGRAVQFTTSVDAEADVTVREETWRDGDDEPVELATHTVAATLVAWDQARLGPAPSYTILSPAMADELDLEVVTRDLRLSGDLDHDTETRIKELVEGVATGTYVYVERGYQRPPEAVVILLVLGALGGVLMLGGTLTATFLALSDARPDLATLSAVGAAPLTRRRVAASYALVVGFVGAVLGAAVGFVPGIAISRPLTSTSFGMSGTETGPFLDIPWLLVAAIVLALPLLTAAVVGLSARSRLPLVARLD
jgi:putative ABC transport system permease protein